MAVATVRAASLPKYIEYTDSEATLLHNTFTTSDLTASGAKSQQ